MRVAVLGAAGQLGRETVRALTGRGHTVIAIVRRMPEPSFGSGVDVRLADGRNAAQLRAAMGGAEVVVNVIGAGTLRRNDVESAATAVAVTAARELGIARYIAMSAGMVALEWPLFKYVLRPLIFRHILEEHRRVEEIVRASPLTWTIVRPSRLTNGRPSGYVASLELQRRFFSSARADVAAFIADEVANNEYPRQAVFVGSRYAH